MIQSRYVLKRDIIEDFIIRFERSCNFIINSIQ